MATHKQLLEMLKSYIRDGVLTPTKRVDLETLICFTEMKQEGRYYHQFEFSKLPEDWRNLLFGRNLGESIGNCKIIAIFDVWPEYIKQPIIVAPTVPLAS
jgi:hypothetical protein